MTRQGGPRQRGFKREAGGEPYNPVLSRSVADRIRELAPGKRGMAPPE